MSEGPQPHVQVVCLVGSTRFADHHAIARWELEREGRNIVLMINYLPDWYCELQGWEGNDHHGEAAGCKEALDELHLRKIDMSDLVLVINPGGYIGESTRREIEYAKSQGKFVCYICDPEGAVSYRDCRGAYERAYERLGKAQAEREELRAEVERLKHAGRWTCATCKHHADDLACEKTRHTGDEHRHDFDEGPEGRQAWLSPAPDAGQAYCVRTGPAFGCVYWEADT